MVPPPVTGADFIGIAQERRHRQHAAIASSPMIKVEVLLQSAPPPKFLCVVGESERTQLQLERLKTEVKSVLLIRGEWKK